MTYPAARDVPCIRRIALAFTSQGCGSQADSQERERCGFGRCCGRRKGEKPVEGFSCSESSSWLDRDEVLEPVDVVELGSTNR